MLFVMNQTIGEITPKWFLVQVDLDMSENVSMMDYGFYHFKWYTKHFEDCTLAHIFECSFWREIQDLKRYGTLGKKVPVAPKKVTKFLEDNQGHVCL